MTADDIPPLLTLPEELLHHVLSYIDPVSLFAISLVCRRLHNASLDNQLWKSIVHENLPGVRLSPSTSFRNLYISHHPHWFLTRHKLWFSDSAFHGKLLILRWDPHKNAIEGYALTAERGQHTAQFWDWNDDVLIHSFNPNVRLDLNSAVVRLRAMPQDASVRPRLNSEIPMNIHGDTTGSRGIKSQFILTRPLPRNLISPGTAVWPPLIFPSAERTRNQTIEYFRGEGHRPSMLSEMSDRTFRIRKWIEFGNRHGFGVRAGEDVNTYATLSEDLYTPTKEKPWRGIWVGDYSGHGCEFLIVMQPDDPSRLPERVEAMFRRDVRERRESNESEDSEESDESEESEESWCTARSDISEAKENEELSESLRPGTWEGINQTDLQRSDDGRTAEDIAASQTTIIETSRDASGEQKPKYEGSIEAIKLTGDPNVPRGEYTFIAPDIGDRGLVRVAQEPIFRGARVVRSVGHIAASGFQDDEFIPSQLIMISHDALAQYWETFGHISYYRRVDVDEFLSVG